MKGFEWTFQKMLTIGQPKIQFCDSDLHSSKGRCSLGAFQLFSVHVSLLEKLQVFLVSHIKTLYVTWRPTVCVAAVMIKSIQLLQYMEILTSCGEHLEAIVIFLPWNVTVLVLLHLGPLPRRGKARSHDLCTASQRKSLEGLWASLSCVNLKFSKCRWEIPVNA